MQQISQVLERENDWVKDENMAHRVRAWYGLPGEIVVERGHWHLVNPTQRSSTCSSGAGSTQLLARIGASPALAYAVWLGRRRSTSQPRPLGLRLVRLAAALIAHQAAWELAAESYVMAKAGRAYRRLYRQHPNPLLTLFWGVMAGLALLSTILSVTGDREYGETD